MNPPRPHHRDSMTPGPDLFDELLTTVEVELAALNEALRRRDCPAIEQHAEVLLRALARTADGFNRPTRAGGGVPALLRERLARTSSLVAVQQESLLRSTAALDRTLEALVPQNQRPVYSQQSLTGACLR